MSNVSTLSRPESESKYQTTWLIDGMLPIGHKGMIACPVGSCKTTLLSWIAVCAALGKPVFGMKTQQGAVLMIDEETPTQTLEKKLYRFCLGFDLEGRYKIPNLVVRSMRDFRFGRQNTEVMEVIKSSKPVLITIDSVIACLPSGRQGRGENNAETGIAMRDDLNRMLDASPDSAILIAAHSGKPAMYYDIEDYREAPMQQLVSGHTSIVGQACDTGYGIMKISEHPKPLCFAIVPKARRDAIFMNETYVEMKELDYGKGWARLEQIAPVPTPPSRAAVDLCSIFLNKPKEKEEVEAQGIRQKASALYTPTEIRLGLDQLRRRKVIVTTKDNFTFKLNPNLKAEADLEYFDQLCQSSLANSDTYSVSEQFI